MTATAAIEDGIDMATPPPDASALVALTTAVNRLTETMALFRVQQDIIMHELSEMREAIGLPAPVDMADMTPPERAVLSALVVEWRLSQPNAPRTIPISVEAGYSQRQTLSILTELARRGVIRRHNRVSWMPITKTLTETAAIA